MSKWKDVNNKLSKDFRFNSYLDGVNFVVEVANLAETHNHHPEINLKYKKVIIITTTHDKGNMITEKDEKLCKDIDSIFNNNFI
ncbi:MAG: putative pterin-4-alpha-carbinolamine dehydratase [Candidatus Heimdallarchaeota archaeon LC_3]|nr:MAG: putative pterin-4-alpha-carbinolamine dehydratase [Candidatus Heimdallarchaeota archaeon LC_3]